MTARRRIDGAGCLVTPGLVNTPPPPLPVGHPRAGAGGHAVRVADRAVPGLGAASTRRSCTPPPRAGLAALALLRLHHLAPTTTTSSRAAAATCSPPRSRRPREIGLRFHPTRGSMDLGHSPGRPAAGRGRRGPRRDPRRHARTRSTATTTRRRTRCCGSRSRPARRSRSRTELMRESAELARAPRRAAAHPPGRDRRRGASSAWSGSAARPVEYVERLGWLGDDVWLAHGVHLDDAEVGPARRDRHRRRALPELQRPARRGHRPGRATCSTPGVPVGLGVDGAASQEAGELGAELRQALLRWPGCAAARPR